MKILMATMALDIGGAETHIVELTKELQRQGHEVVVVSNGGVYVPEILAAGARHYNAPLHRRAVGDMRRAYGVLKDVVRKEQPDIVHAHARIPAMLCGQLAKREKFPFVTSCHGVYQISGVLRALSDWGERTLAVSEDIRDYLMKEYHIPEEQIRLTINGIDTEKFSPETSGQKIREEFALEQDTVIGHVSRLDEEPAIIARHLIDIAPELDKAIPGVRVLITGGGTAFEELRKKAEEMNRRLGRACLVLTGPRTDIPEIMAASDLFVGVSRAALEAMAAGKAVVLSGAQGHTGLFVPEKLQKAVDTNFCCRTDAVAEKERMLREILEAMALSREKREELGLYGRETVIRLYSVERMTKDALEIYQQVRRRRYHVVMSGYYGFSNAGDDAILDSISHSVTELSDDVAITVLSNDPALTQRQFGLHAVPRFHALKVFSALRKSDVLLSGGGSLLQDTTSTRSILYYLAVMSTARMLGKPVMLYANGIGPVRKEGNRRRTKNAVEKAAVVTLRDNGSQRELRQMGVKRSDLRVTADPVFRLPPASPERAEELLKECGMPEGKDFVVVSVRSWPNTEKFFGELAKLCDHLRRRYGLEVLFMMMQPSHDRAATERVMQAMEEKAFVLDCPCTPRDLMGVLGKAKLCLAMRLHTLIFAARMAVPTMGLVYDPKVENYLQELDLPSAGHVERFDAKAAITAADTLMADYDGVLAGMKEKSEALTKAAGENERLLLELLEKTKK
ncbi:MAG: polysaccharide pyruvyl transferase CsaB [Oscillibacter sp.]|nr:polysaccharide pyruvyl transferase CsaB [Oscillibacter sp.]